MLCEEWTGFCRASAWALTSLLLGCAATPNAQRATTERHEALAANELARRTDADSLAAAGLLISINDRERALSLLARSTAAAPVRADLLWLQVRVCHEVASCDPELLERRLRDLDPANGSGWLDALARAASSNDASAQEEALAAIAHSDRIDIYWTTLLGRMSAVAADTGKVSPQEALESVAGVLAAQTIPAYSPLSNACKGERLQGAAVIEQCRRIARALENGDSSLTAGLGSSLAQRVWPVDSPQWQAAAEARRVSEYRTHLWSRYETDLPWNTQNAKNYIALCARYHREQDLLVAQLIHVGANPDPPVN